jgi:hypothetical protein
MLIVDLAPGISNTISAQMEQFQCVMNFSSRGQNEEHGPFPDNELCFSVVLRS